MAIKSYEAVDKAFVTDVTINIPPYLESHVKVVYRLFLMLLVATLVRWL